MGNVHKPGPIPLRDLSPPTVMRILSIARVLSPTPQIAPGSTAKIHQVFWKKILYPLKSILARKSPDMPLFPGDLLYIPR